MTRFSFRRGRGSARARTDRAVHRATKWTMDNKGGMAVFAAVLAPVLVAFGSLAVDTANYGYRNQLLHQATQAAALAASDSLGTYYTTGSSNTVISIAQTYGSANMSSATYGNIISNSNVTLGTWSSTAKTFTSGASSPNAVQVTGSYNMPTIFGSMFGKTNIALSTTVVASYTTTQEFDTIVLNDMSQSFQSELSNQQALDLAILNCVKGYSGSTSKFGLTLFNGHSTLSQALTQASTNLTALTSVINLLTDLSCLLNCSTGSNIAAGIYSATQQFNSSSYNGKNKNIVIVTDGVPNAKSTVDYEAADGIYTTAAQTTYTCKGVNHCTDDNMLTMAQNQATIAYSNGINVSTVYYSGSTSSADEPSYETSLGSLRRGTGVSLVAPNAGSINTSSAGFCTTIPSSPKTVSN